MESRCYIADIPLGRSAMFLKNHCRPSPIVELPPYHFDRYRFYLYIFILLAVILWKTEYITEYNTFIINCHIFEQMILLYVTLKKCFSVHPKMRIRNYTKSGEGLQCCRSSPGEESFANKYFHFD